MITMNLQYFGGRGGAGGKRTESAEVTSSFSGTNEELRKTLADTASDVFNNGTMLNSSDMRSKALDSMKLRDILHIDSVSNNDDEDFTTIYIEKWKKGQYYLHKAVDDTIYTGNSEQIKAKLESLLKGRHTEGHAVRITQAYKAWQSKENATLVITARDRKIKKL